MCPPDLTVEQLRRALERCMATHPPQGIERSLYPDADALAGVWALTTHARRPPVAVEDVSADVMDAYGRWSRA